MKYREIYRENWQSAPLAPWVHRTMSDTFPGDDDHPPSPVKTLRGFCWLIVNTQGLELEFSSQAQLEHFCDIMGRKHLPTTRQLCEGRLMGPNTHWLSRLPARAKKWSVRQKIIKDLHKLTWPEA